MADETPPRGGTNPLKQATRFVSQHKVPVLLAGGGGAYLFLSRRGAAGAAGTDAGTYGTIVPVMQAMSASDAATDPGTFPDDPTIPNTPLPVPDDPAFPADPVIPADPALPPEAPTPDSTQATPAATTQPPVETKAVSVLAAGITISGTNIPGATGRTSTGSGRNSFGTYSDWLVTFPGGSAHYYHYYADENGKSKDKVTGPHDPKGSIPAAAHVADDSPAPVAVKPPPAPTPVNTPQNFPGVPAPTNGWDAVWQMMNLNGDIWEIHHYTSGPKTGTVESRGWVANAGQKFKSGNTPPAGWSVATPGLAGKFGFQFQRQVDTRAY